MPAKSRSRPNCPCDFCVRVRAEIAEGRSEKDEQNKIAEDFLRSHSQTKPSGAWRLALGCVGKLVKRPSNKSFVCLRRERERFAA
jgi:hypothetical protein